MLYLFIDRVIRCRAHADLRKGRLQIIAQPRVIDIKHGILLIDEDTSATNFMIRDELMQRVIHRDMEPITPFLDRIRELYENYGTSTVIVAGSSGSYFHIADTIIQMDRYVPKDITAYAKKEAENFPMISSP